MQLTELRLENLRNIASAAIELDPGINLFVGSNGAGKTSILEGAYLLSHAQSFRAGQTNTLIRRGTERMNLFARVERQSGPVQIGLSRTADGWSGRINKDESPSLGDVLREYAQVCFEPGTHALISGGSEERRRFLDWGVFHVEPDFMSSARAFRRALRQRNALLKQERHDAELDGWDSELARLGEAMAAMRWMYFQRYSGELAAALAIYLPELGEPKISFRRGWAEDASLRSALEASRALDRARGHTARGPHRADWSLGFAAAPMREHLSRGQEKLCALACVLAQARLFAHSRGEWPVIALDDLSSELDVSHQRLVVQSLAGSGAQILISAIELPDCLRDIDASTRLFHVEHGGVRSLL